MTRVEGSQLVVRTELVAADGSDLAPLEVRVPVARADLLDPTATPGLTTLTTIAAARGEDLVVEGSVDEVAAANAVRLGTLLSDWWGTGTTTTVTVADTHSAPPTPHRDGVGLFFSRGVDSWSTLLDLLAEGPPDRVTHLYHLHHTTLPVLRPIEHEIVADIARIAAELELELVVVDSDARALLDPHRPWLDTYGPVIVGAGLQAGAGLGRLVMTGANRADVHYRTSADPDLVALLGTGSTEVLLGNPDRDRQERVAHVLTDPRARSTLLVCWEGGSGHRNCGRCLKCLLTMSALALAGDPDPTAGFDAPLDPDRVRELNVGHSLFVPHLIRDLGPEHEELRRAWSDAWDRGNDVAPRARWGDDAPPPLAGPSVATRVATALWATTGQADAPTPAPLGWRPGTVPLRPAADRHHEVRALAASAPDRAVAWAVVEPHIRDGARDPHQAGLARRLHDTHGRGACYLPGILWAYLDPPALGPDAVARLLRTARARLWWRPDGDLEPLRVVETIEHGCLPLQVMPDGTAGSLAAVLPPALVPLVVAESALATLDLSPAGVTARLGPATDHLLLGSAEHDLLAGAYR